MSEGWLACGISKGMFSDEVAISYRDVSVFVSKELVDAGHRKLRVKFFNAGSSVWVVLPTPTQDVVEVDRSDLVAA
jgi:hypothetical protein